MNRSIAFLLTAASVPLAALSRRTASLALLLACSAIQGVMGQAKPAPELRTFEVAAVKPIDPNAPSMVGIEVYPAPACP